MEGAKTYLFSEKKEFLIGLRLLSKRVTTLNLSFCVERYRWCHIWYSRVRILKNFATFGKIKTLILDEKISILFSVMGLVLITFLVWFINNIESRQSWIFVKIVFETTCVQGVVLMSCVGFFISFDRVVILKLNHASLWSNYGTYWAPIEKYFFFCAWGISTLNQY